MKHCKIKNCKNKFYAKNFCYNHYVKYNMAWYRKALNNGTYKKIGICSVENCNLGLYAKKYCRKHYQHFITFGYPKRKLYINIGKKCKIRNCKNKPVNKGFCSTHIGRIYKHGNPYTVLLPPKGKRNAMWKGGVAEYPNHSLMKRNRLKKFEQANGKCEICRKKVQVIHHKKSKDNHSLKELMALCKKCHWKLHTGRKNSTSKFIRLYGMTLTEMNKKLNRSTGFVWKHHFDNTLDSILAEEK